MQDTLNVESLKFNAEIGKVLNLVIHSLYTNKDIFLRELISNASDACDKMRYLSLSDQNLMESCGELKINISINADQRQLIISDNGIGMNRQDLIDNLGTIASSGTQKFLEMLKQQDKAKSIDLIGKFGVGFYSSFMVASEVTVESRKAGENDGWKWYSTGENEFNITKLDYEIPRGTKITLTLKPEECSFLDKFRIEQIVTNYSDYTSYPINFINDKNEEEQLNSKSAIWTKPKNEVSHEEHLDFYRSVAHVGGEPWMILHNKNEGVIEYTNLLYIPSIKPFDLFHPDRRCSIKLYVNKVFITEDNVQIIPQYLRFLRGVIDSADLPLNISRETLQNNVIIDKIKSSLVKKVFSELQKKAESDIPEYTKFWNNFGPVLKEGLCEASNTEHRESLLKICRFHSTYNNAEELISLEDYIGRIKADQKYIYYLTGNDLESIKKNPHLEGFNSRGLEVILLTDPVDDFWTNVIHEYKNYQFKSVTKSDSDLETFSITKNNESDSNDNTTEDFEPLLQYFTKTLDKLVSSVRISKKLTNSPVCLAVAEGSMDIRMERFLREQKQLNYKSSKILEINPKHQIIQNIAKTLSTDPDNALLKDVVHTLFAQACIIEGEEINNTSDFANYLNNILSSLKI